MGWREEMGELRAAVQELHNDIHGYGDGYYRRPGLAKDVQRAQADVQDLKRDVKSVATLLDDHRKQYNEHREAEEAKQKAQAKYDAYPEFDLNAACPVCFATGPHKVVYQCECDDELPCMGIHCHVCKYYWDQKMPAKEEE